VTRRLMRTKAFLKSRDQRKRVEMRFAHLKIHCLGILELKPVG